tara:strand:+ start:195 stop:1139 length:945 start_codon:yes stop_codon:yes gene_type:complete
MNKIRLSNDTLPATQAGGVYVNIAKNQISFLSRYANKQSQNVVSGQLAFFGKYARQAGVRLEQINQDDITIYARHLRDSGLRNSTYNARLSALKNYMEHIGKKGFSYPFQKIESYSKTRIISDTDFKNIVRYLKFHKAKEGIKQAKHMRDYLFFSLAFFTGMRKSEVLNLKYSDLQYEGDKLKYTAICKGNKEVRKDFPDALIADLNTLQQLEKKSNDDYVFTSLYGLNRARLAPNAYNRIVNQYNKKINGRTHNVTVHGIRNLSAFTLYKTTKDILKTQQHCNHTSLNTTHIYLSKLTTNNIDYYDKMESELA